MDVDLGIEGLSELEQIGRGGSARVYKARQDDLDRWVAVKVLHSAWDEGVQRRFDRERRAMGRLSDHPGIAPVYATGKTSQDEPYIIMPFYEAGSLAQRIDQANPVDWREATTLIAAVAETLGDAHKEQIVHRDIKPANILLAPDGRPKVADFGISRLSSSETASQSTALSFTPAYAPPESFVTATATPAVDVYGLAATLFALVAGRPPFTGEDLPTDVLSVINRVANHDVANLRPTVPDAICSVIERGMAKEPEDRPANGAEFLAELRAAIAAAEAGVGLETIIPGTQTDAKKALIVPSATAANSANGANGEVAATEADTFTGDLAGSESETFVPLLPGRALFGVPDAASFASNTTVHGPSGVVHAAAPAAASPVVATAATGRPNKVFAGVAAAVALLLFGGVAFALNARGGDSQDGGIEVAGVTQASTTDTSAPTSTETSAPSTTVELVEEEGSLDDLDADFLAELEVVTPPRRTTTTQRSGSNTPSTTPPPTVPVPSVFSVRLVELGADRAVVQVQADACTSATYSVANRVDSVNTGTCSTNHRIVIGQLSPSTDYRMIVVVANAGGNSVPSIVSFRTLARPVVPTDPPPVTSPPTPPVVDPTNPDPPVVDPTDPPVITSGPRVTSLNVDSISDTTARITYGASECTGTEYTVSGVKTGRSGYPNSNTCVTDHQLLLGRQDFGGTLSPETKYTVTVVVIDADGNRSAPRSISFTTKPTPAVDVAPVISGFRKTATSQTSGTVSFQTDICAGSRFYLNGALDHKNGYPENSECWNVHARTFNGLQPGTSYRVTVEAYSKGGKNELFKPHVHHRPGTCNDDDDRAGHDDDDRASHDDDDRASHDDYDRASHDDHDRAGHDGCDRTRGNNAGGARPGSRSRRLTGFL